MSSYQNIACHRHVNRNPCDICSGNPVLHCHSYDSEHRSAHIHLCLHHKGLALETKTKKVYIKVIWNFWVNLPYTKEGTVNCIRTSPKRTDLAHWRAYHVAVSADVSLLLRVESEMCCKQPENCGQWTCWLSSQPSWSSPWNRHCAQIDWFQMGVGSQPLHGPLFFC